MGLYTETRKMRFKKLSSETIWDGFKKFFVEEYHDLRKLKHTNATQSGFHGTNTDITVQDNTAKAIENVSIHTT